MVGIVGAGPPASPQPWPSMPDDQVLDYVRAYAYYVRGDVYTQALKDASRRFESDRRG